MAWLECMHGQQHDVRRGRGRSSSRERRPAGPPPSDSGAAARRGRFAPREKYGLRKRPAPPPPPPPYIPAPLSISGDGDESTRRPPTRGARTNDGTSRSGTGRGSFSFSPRMAVAPRGQQRPAKLDPFEFYQMLIDFGPEGIWQELRRRQLLQVGNEETGTLSDADYSFLPVGTTLPPNAPRHRLFGQDPPALIGAAPQQHSFGAPTSGGGSGASSARSPLHRGSAGLHRAFIPKLYAIDSWRPRLCNLLLPKYLLALDCRCIAHLYRSLGRLQPKGEEASTRAAPSRSPPSSSTEAQTAGLPADHRQGRPMARKAVPLGAGFMHDAMSGAAARERAAFELVVLAVGAAVAPKLTPSGGKEGGSWSDSDRGGEGEGLRGRGSDGLEDPPPPLGFAGALAAIPLGLAECGVWDPRLLLAWERACLVPLAPRPSSPPPPCGLRGTVVATPSRRLPKRVASPGSPPAGSAGAAPAEERGTVTLMHRMAPRHLAAVAAGLGAMRLVPGPAWQAAFFNALLHRLHRFAPQQLADLLHGLAGMGQPPPESPLANALLAAARGMLEASTADRPPKGPPSPGRYRAASDSPSREPSPRELKPVAAAVAGHTVTPVARREIGVTHVTRSGTHVTAVLTWAAAAGIPLPAEWLSWYTAFIRRALLTSSRRLPSSSGLNKQAASSVTMRPRDHLAILEALARQHERGLLPHQRPPPLALPQLQTAHATRTIRPAAVKPSARNPLAAGAPSAADSPAAETFLGGDVETTAGAAAAAAAARSGVSDDGCGIARLVTGALVPAAAHAAKRQLANGPLVARTCAALARLAGGGGGGSGSSRLQAMQSPLLPPPERRYIAAVEAATRWHMPTLSVAEVASTAEALAAWCGQQQHLQQDGPTEPGSSGGKAVPTALGGRGSGKPASLVAPDNDDQQPTLLPAAWSASAVVHTRRPAVLRACRDASELLELAEGFRSLGCRAPPLWFEAVLEEALWRCRQGEQWQQQPQGGRSKGPKEQGGEAGREASNAGRQAGCAGGGSPPNGVGVESHRGSGAGDEGKQPLVVPMGWSSVAQSSRSSRRCDKVTGLREHESGVGSGVGGGVGGGVSVDDGAAATAAMTVAQLAELRMLLQSVPGAEDAMRLLALGRPDLLEPSEAGSSGIVVVTG